MDFKIDSIYLHQTGRSYLSPFMARISRLEILQPAFTIITYMLIDHEYEHLFKEFGVEDKESQERVLEYIFNLARLGIECVNNKLNVVKQ